MTNEKSLYQNLVESDKSAVESYLTRIKNLPQFKNKTKEDLRLYAIKKLKLKIGKIIFKDNDLGREFSFVDENERSQYINLYDIYFKEFSNINVSDKNLLKTLVYLEILNFRVQEKLTKYAKEDEVAPSNLVNQFQSNINQTLVLKEKLGLSRDKEGKDPLEVINTLRTQFENYIKEHPKEFTTRCPECGIFYLIRRRTVTKCPHCDKHIEMEKILHPFLLKGKTLYNEKIMKLIEEGKIDFQDGADILNTSSDYVRQIYNEIYKKQ